MGVFKVIRNTNDGLEYMYHALNYVCYGHTDSDKRYSINTDIFHACDQFLWVKKYYGKTSMNPVFHFIVVYDARKVFSIDIAECDSRSIASYFSDKYQIVWCIHQKRMSKKYGGTSSLYHAHFVMNSVNYKDGRLFGGNRAEIYDFLNHIKKVTRDHSWIVQYGSDDSYENNMKV